MKKIQVSTVQMTSDAEVVVLNSYTVAKAARAAAAVENFKEFLEGHWQPGKQDSRVPDFLITRLSEFVFPFVEEFAKAFEGDENHYKSEGI